LGRRDIVGGREMRALSEVADFFDAAGRKKDQRCQGYGAAQDVGGGADVVTHLVLIGGQALGDGQGVIGFVIDNLGLGWGYQQHINDAAELRAILK
jgi:hypothetical protein